MGLDVYLYQSRKDDKAKLNQAEKEYDEYTSKLWAETDPMKYDYIPEERKEKIRKLSALMEEKLDLPNLRVLEKQIKIDSPTYPEHYFKIGYLRSSYNDSGFNKIMRDLIGKDLTDIFEPDEEYEFTPNWKRALKIATEMLDEAKEKVRETGGDRVLTLHFPAFTKKEDLPKSTQEAAKIYQAQLERKSAFKGGYANAFGEFYLNEPIQIKAMMPGTEEGILSGTRPCVYLVVHPTGDNEGAKWYIQALEITIEMIEFVLSQKNPEEYYLHWSA